jgi:hypothetical protein
MLVPADPDTAIPAIAIEILGGSQSSLKLISSHIND